MSKESEKEARQVAPLASETLKAQESVDAMPARRFISLQSVLDHVRRSRGIEHREAARWLRIQFENALGDGDTAPEWRRRTDVESDGVWDAITDVWGPKLLQHAEIFDQPVVFTADFYTSNGFDVHPVPVGSAYEFLENGPTIGFRRADIRLFLQRRNVEIPAGASRGDVAEDEARPLPPRASLPQGPVVRRAEPAETDDVSVAPMWQVIRPIRPDELGLALYSTLSSIKASGADLPSVHVVLDVWRKDKPAAVQEVMDDELKFHSSAGKLKVIDLRDLGKRIKRMTTPRTMPD